MTTTPQYRVTAWGREAQAREALRNLDGMGLQCELGPSEWEGEHGVILYGGAPIALIDKILKIVGATIAIDLRKSNCWGPDNNEIRMLLPPPYRVSVWGQELAARRAQRRLEHVMLDVELGPSTWDSEEGHILHGGAPSRLLDMIRQVAAPGAWRKERPCALGSDEIRLVLPEIFLLWGRTPAFCGGKYELWARECSADRLRAVLWAAGGLGARLDGDAQWTARFGVGGSSRMDVGLDAIRRAVAGQAVTFPELRAGIHNEALEPSPGVAEAQDAALASDLTTAPWTRGLDDDHFNALLSAIGEVGIRLSPEFEFDPSQLRGGAPALANVAVHALRRAVHGGGPTMAQLEAEFASAREPAPPT